MEGDNLKRKQANLASAAWNEPIAIIGTGCRFPGNANTPSKFWDLLCNPRDVLSSVAGRFSPEGWHHHDGKYHGHCNVRSSYLLEGDQHCRFDAQFFGINGVEAETLDPQVRLLLETVYEALEGAGLTIEGLRGSDTAVYTGMMGNSYKTLMERDVDSIGTYHVSGTSAAMMSNRLSYFFDWRGPSITIDTACSSSLVAVHQAVQQLRAGHSRIAVAAGSNLILDPADYISMSKLDMLSPDGRSRMWDKDANGYARGEGVAAIVLKTLSAAEADGDHIECIIRETATNQDGRTRGITIPTAQAQLIQDCYARAGLDLTDAQQRPQYFEAHGTGTPAGDPVEAEAIRRAFFPATAQNMPTNDERLLVGGVKTVIGHSESTAGLAGLIKVSLALQHAIVPPNLLFNQINPKVEPFYKGFLQIPTKATAWPDSAGAQGNMNDDPTAVCRRASVNSFVILSSATPSSSSASSPSSLLPTVKQPGSNFLPLVFSANSESALISNLVSTLKFIRDDSQGQKNIDLRDLAMTLYSRRSRLPYCVSFSASNLDDLCRKIEAEVHANNTTSRRIKTLPPWPQASTTSSGAIKTKTKKKKKLLLIFTGQGAQSPRMGASLIEQSPTCAAVIDKLEARLARLVPEKDRPSWSLKRELVRHLGSNNDRNDTSDGGKILGVGKAALSQPLCTALQILQVDLLRSALPGDDDVEMAAAVGHSSGEIAAAYCAGVISAEDAICVAYYRGLGVSRRSSEEKTKGAMLAVGTAFQDAISLCNEPEFLEGTTPRLEVAAVNSPKSVTLSGDADAVEEAAVIFEDEGKPVTRLRVDNKAYHSRHMIPCSAGYRAALERLHVDVNLSRGDDSSCHWVSSVGKDANSGSGMELMVPGGQVSAASCSAGMLKADYWVENMTRPVMFLPAVQRAWHLHGPFDMIVEVGPHPALKRPTLDSIREMAGEDAVLPPYTGLHVRSQDAIESFAEALGQMWMYLGHGAAAASVGTSSSGSSPVKLDGYDKFVAGNMNMERLDFKLVKGLPPYSWDHVDKKYWHESRFTRALRLRSKPVHELLGHLSPDSTGQDMRWRNILSPREIPWLSGHSLQNQLVFPAAGYVVAAADAAMAMVKESHPGDGISLMEILDVDIHNALTFDSEDSRVEVIISLTDIRQTPGPGGTHSLSANFKFNSSPVFAASASSVLTLMAAGRVRVTLGEADDAVLPRRDLDPSRFVPDMTQIDSEHFYSSLEKLEYQYGGSFRSLSALQRRLGFATGEIPWEPSNSMLIHPGLLDAAFQSVFLAHCAPNSGGIWAMHIPKAVRAIQINPHLCRSVEEQNQHQAGIHVGVDCTMDSALSSISPRGKGHGEYRLSADVDIFHKSETMLMRVQGLECVPFSQPSPQDDATMFGQVVWDVAAPNANFLAEDGQPSTTLDWGLHSLLDRVAISYLSHLDRSVPADHPSRLPSSPYFHYYRYASHVLSLANQDNLPLFSPSHASDDDLAAASEPYRDVIDFKLLTAIGDNIVDIATGKTSAIDVGMREGMLSDYYQRGSGFDQQTPQLARLVRQIVHRYGGPNFRILEVGAGTGGATTKILEEVLGTYNVGFANYTFTDISSGFFDRARERLFGPNSPVQSSESSIKNLVFKVLDVTKDVRGQGFVPGAYDLVIASAVLHATPNLADTLLNVRRLLKPGGFLAVLEMPDLSSVAMAGTIFGAMPGWWLGADDGRGFCPCIDLAEWDSLLRSTGFSGCDTTTRSHLVQGDIDQTLIFTFVSQAVDDRIQYLREPLSMPWPGGAQLQHELFPPDQNSNLVLIGGGTLQTSRLVAQLSRVLASHWTRSGGIQTVRSLSDVLSLRLPVGSQTTVLSLVDVVDKRSRCNSAFQNLTENDWEGLKVLLQQAGTMLWVSTGRRIWNAHANMMVGLLRVAKHEIPTLDMQTLDIEVDDSELDARELAETLLRFQAAARWRRRDGQEDLLLTIEPELVRQTTWRSGHGTRPITSLMIPRVVANKVMNNRYNSARRPIFMEAPSQLLDTSSGENYRLLSNTEGRDNGEEPEYSLRRIPAALAQESNGCDSREWFQTEYSLAARVRVPSPGNQAMYMYLVLGHDSVEKDRQVVSLTFQPTLFFSPLAGLSVSVLRTVRDKSTLLPLVAYHIMSTLFLQQLSLRRTATGAVVIYEPPDTTFATVMLQVAERLGLAGLRFILIRTSSTEENHMQAHAPALKLKCQWRTIHPRAADSVIRALLPHDTIAFLALLNDDDETLSRLRSYLPRHCYYRTLDSYFSWREETSLSHQEIHEIPEDDELSEISTCLKDCVAKAAVFEHHHGQAFGKPSSHLICLNDDQLPRVGIQPQNNRRVLPLPLNAVVDWVGSSTSKSDSVSFRVQPADSLVALSSSKTYWLAGLSGSLGLVLCEWMISRGARYFVISSRNAEQSVDQVWVNKMRDAHGAVISVVSCDLADKAALSEVYHGRIQTSSSLPPVGGVCQGAMVLDDVSIQDMSLSNFLKVTRPKVQGSLHLDELFQRDEGLDFFVYFSSAGSISGQPGQANYAAANLFMTTLAEQRRRRGQAASVMHIGPIIGAGYITRQGLEPALVHKSSISGWFPITERDFFQHFSEAILAGRGRSRDQPLEITSGLCRLASSETASASAFLGHYCLVPDLGQGEELNASKLPGSLVPLKARLAEATGHAELESAIREALLHKLSVLFQASLEELEQADPVTLSLSQMGVDSLMAVELRSWFVKTMQVNMPVLKILGGATVAELVNMAVETIPRLLTPNMKLPVDVDQEEKIDRTNSSHTSDKTTLTSISVADSTASTGVDMDTPPSDAKKLDMEIKSSAIGDHGILAQPARTLTVHRKLDKVLPLSYSQSLFWFSAAFSSSSPTSLNVTTGFRMTGGKLRIDKLKEAVMATGQQHESLRTCFYLDPSDGQPKQGIMSMTALELEDRYENLQQDLFRHDILQHHLDQVHNHVYDLEAGKTTRLVLISQLLENDSIPSEYLLIIGTHHLAMDGASFLPMLGDILQNYTRLCAAQPHQLEVVDASNTSRSLQYPDYSQKQHEVFEAGGFSSELEFWRSELMGSHGPPPTLPILRSESRLTTRPNLQTAAASGSGNRYVNLQIEPSISAQIQALCRSRPSRRATTPFHFYLAVFRVLLWRYSGGTEAFSIGIADANRTDEEMTGSIGNFLNLLPLVFGTGTGTGLGATPFEAILDHVSSKTHMALANSQVPFQLILNELGVQRSANTTPIFQAFADYRLARGDKTRWGAAHQLELVSLQLSQVAYDIAIDILDNNKLNSRLPANSCKITLILRSDLYSQDDAQRLADSYSQLVATFAATPGCPVGEADVFSPSEMQHSLSLGRGPTYQPPKGDDDWGETVIHRLVQMAQQFPNKRAVVYDNPDHDDNSVASVSYHDVVCRKPDQIVAQLQRAGVSAGDRVAVLQEPTADWVSSIIAVMKMGAAYLPLDPGQPATRLAAMVNDAQPEVVLVDDDHDHTKELAQKVLLLLACSSSSSSNTGGIKVVSLRDTEGQGSKSEPPSNIIVANRESVSAILYTSGSTGTPKGIVLTHGGMTGWLSPCDTLYGLLPKTDVVTLQQSAPGFDMSLMQIFSALCFGGAVYLLPRKLRGDGRAISDAIVRHKVTHTFSTPSEVTAWIRHASSSSLSLLRNSSSAWQTALVGGEMLSPGVLAEFARLDKPDLRFHHMYGTTEATFCAAAVELDYRRHALNEGPEHPCYLPAGVALPNYKIYILDEFQRPVPAGLQGEVYIGGAGVRKHSQYLNNAALSGCTFLNDPFASDEERARGEGCMQRTGDLGRWDASSSCMTLLPPPGSSTTTGGILVIEGRIQGDTMVKLRGLRVDLREVEIALLRASLAIAAAETDDDAALKDVVVSVRRTTEDSPEFLVAHVLLATTVDDKPSPSRTLSPSHLKRLRAELERQGLPLNLQPSFIVPVERLPVTISGKLDRKAVLSLPITDDQESNSRIDDGSSDHVWTPTEERLKAIWADMLTSTVQITPESDWFHIGGTSLSLLRLRDGIQKEFAGVQLPLVDLFEASVLSDMARRIQRALGSPPPALSLPRHQPIDWDEETKLEPSMFSKDNRHMTAPVPSPSQSGSTSTNHDGKVVILTGATGHLGSALVRSLTADPTVAEVHCLAVRNPFSRPDIAPLRAYPKVTLYPGDLGQPHMGLFPSSESDSIPDWLLKLFGRADIIIHNGADTSYLKTYHSLRAANLTSTKDLVHWSLVATAGGKKKKMIPLHFISTAGVGNLLCPSGDHAELGPVSVSSINTVAPSSSTAAVAVTPPTDGSMGYTSSKWASERFLERLVSEQYPDTDWQWEVYIHRPTVISRGKELATSAKNSSKLPEFDGVHNILWYARQLNAVPSAKGIARGVLNIVNLEDVVDGILSAALDRKGKGRGGGVHFLNHTGDLNLPLHEMHKWASVKVRGGDEDGYNMYLEDESGDDSDGIDDESMSEKKRKRKRDDEKKLLLPEIVPLGEWVRRACELGMHPALAELLLSFARPGKGEVMFPVVVTTE
ncbi:hypothetical protein QBC37DRAFT_455500 [Rhypophila decipiens]|uniref:Polyketide synthase n=1 Tax=Rhypophila decipiens TaxID=261697 RepID=A0AAN6XVM7_9PEZI|nr:hypothetical protein QBC37DRAFT_455500 [Rhypophila decipiens]